MNTKQKGAIGEQMVILDLLKRGYRVLTPVTEDSPYDLLVDTGNGFIKVQVKYREDLCVPRSRSHADSNGSHIKRYTEDEMDVFAIVSPNVSEVAYVPLKYAGISLKEELSLSWGYLFSDFTKFPCSDEYEKKVKLSNEMVVSSSFKDTIHETYDSSISLEENATKHNIPYHTYRSWLI